MSKDKRDAILIELYQKWIHPKLSSPYFPELSREDILKIEAKKRYNALYKEYKEAAKKGMGKELERLFVKKHGRRPESLISKKGWFFIPDAKEKDVSSVHFSFGFEDNKKEYWVEIALNSVTSVEQFLSMSENEIKEFFELCKNKTPRMILTLTKKTKKYFAGLVEHDMIFEKEMCKLTEQDIAMVRVKANEINNLRDPLVKPFIGLCAVNRCKKEELAGLFSQMEDIFEFIRNLIPRDKRYKNTLREEKQLENRFEEVKAEIERKTKLADFMRRIGKYEDQEKLEKDVIKLKQELEDINKTIEKNEELLTTLKKDMGKEEN